jgi:hypothetical protein
MKGSESSIVYVSDENLFIILPAGVRSKKKTLACLKISTKNVIGKMPAINLMQFKIDAFF